MSYRSLGSDEVTLRNYRPVGRRKGNMSLSDPLAAGVVVNLHKPGPQWYWDTASQASFDFWPLFYQKKLVGTCRFNRRELPTVCAKCSSSIQMVL